MKKKFTLLACLVALLCIEKALPQHMKADTAIATKGDRGQFEAEKLVKLLTDENYHFSMPYNIGIRFINNGSKSSSFYSGSKGELLKDFYSFIIPDHSQVEICAVIADEKNADNVRYHIVQNGEREIVPWTKPTVFRSTRIGNVSYCYLGKFDYSPAQLLKVQMYDVNDNAKNLYTIMIDWRVIHRPSFFGIVQYVSSSFPQGWGLQERGLNDTTKTNQPYYNRKTGKPTHVPYKDFIETRPLPDKMKFPTDIKFRLGDSLQNISFKNFSFLDARNNNGTYDKTYDFKVSLTRKIGSHADTIDLGNSTASFELNREFWKYPGKYVLTIIPDIKSPDGSAITIPTELIQTISFTVLPALDVKRVVSEKTAAYIILIILTTGGFMFMMYRRQQKQKLAREAQNKQIATLQLQSVRSQLNPHFIFNALAGIQNLINKNAIEDANKYLTRFARLTRNVLDDGQKDLISIEQEISLLDDYLQMEQTRFGFKFNIDAAHIDRQVEIPAMLLQPFVENAVKHGISALKSEGLVTVSITKNNNDILLTVQDNGMGFNPQQTGGIGIKLCRDRIALFNSIYKNTTILLHITPDSKGTLITIKLKNWL